MRAGGGVPGRIEWGLAALTMPGQERSGDGHVIVELPKGPLVGVIDGLGHGHEASEATRTAIAAIRAHAPEPLVELMQSCHLALERTRGAVMCLASFDLAGRTMTWLCVGNILGYVFHLDNAPGPGRGRADKARDFLVQQGGVVGFKLPNLRPAMVPFRPGDTLALTTDGISDRFSNALDLSQPPQNIADAILEGYSRRNDDALVLVGRLAIPVKGRAAPRSGIGP